VKPHLYLVLTSSFLRAARQVSVCLVSKSDAADQQKMLNVEAKPFVPENLKTLFEQPPTTFMSCERPLDILFSHRYVVSCLIEPCCSSVKRGMWHTRPACQKTLHRLH